MTEIITQNTQAGEGGSRRCFMQQLLPLAILLLAPRAIFAQQIDTFSVASLNRRKLKKEGVSIDIPTLADSGNSIPVKLDLQAPSGLHQDIDLALEFV